MGMASARENIRPAIALWVFASAIVFGFYMVPPVTSALEALGRIKHGWGFLYSALSTGIFGGFLPFLWRLWINRSSGRIGSTAVATAPAAWKVGISLALFWSYKGVEIDAFYRFQALLFGNGANAAAIIPKVLVDQFIYNPIWAGWTQILFYWWMEQNFCAKALGDRALWSNMGQRTLTILVSTWAVWIPMVSIIYAMPSTLQIPLFNIVLCFWSIMLVSLTDRLGKKNH